MANQPKLRGYFAIGAEGITKPLNFGNMVRSAHAFGASFVFTVAAETRAVRFRSDTSRTTEHVPYFRWETLDDMTLPPGCALVGVEITDDAIDLPTFPHPPRAAYVLGAERTSLSPAMLDRCDHVVKIPTQFSVNMSMAGAIVMYDRIKTLGRFARRPVGSGQSAEPLDPHVHGKSKVRTVEWDKVLPGAVPLTPEET